MARDDHLVDSASIISDIERVFAKVSRGDGVTLHEAEVIDDCGGDRARARARRSDTDKRWQDVTDTHISEHYSILSFLDTAGFRYYIPAYMRWSLRHFKESDSATSDFTIYAFQTGHRPFDTIFSDDESRVITRFLRFMRDHGDGHADEVAAGDPLSSYWHRYDD